MWGCEGLDRNFSGCGKLLLVSSEPETNASLNRTGTSITLLTRYLKQMTLFRAGRNLILLSLKDGEQMILKLS